MHNANRLARSVRASYVKALNNASVRSASTGSPAVAIDVHTHMYLPGYMDILRKRTQIPRVSTISGSDRLIILPGEDAESTTSAGRPIGSEYFDVNAKLRYMDRHNIDKSVISLANPWLDFLEGAEAEAVAQQLNDELQQICEKSKGRLYGFATLPVRNAAASVREVRRLKQLSCIKGVILGTPGAGKGLDDKGMFDILREIESNKYTTFLHPHYGVGTEHFHDSGHSLFLALGFPFETTISIARLIVSGTFDKFPELKILVAHAGAALPSLIGRLDSCVHHDHAVCHRLKHDPSDYLKKLYFDAISYSTPALQSLISVVGTDRVMFGTDNPFFPPLNVKADEIATSSALWPSTTKVFEVVNQFGPETEKKILYQNAKKILGV